MERLTRMQRCWRHLCRSDHQARGRGAIRPVRLQHVGPFRRPTQQTDESVGCRSGPQLMGVPSNRRFGGQTDRVGDPTNHFATCLARSETRHAAGAGGFG